MRQALANLAPLPPEIAIPTFVALNQPKPWRVSNPAEVIANVLRNYGDIFLALVDALTDDLRTVLLPLPEQSAMVNALRDVARDDPTTAQRLAYAFRTHDHHGALHVLQTAPSYHVAAICGAMDDADLRAAVDSLAERPDVLRAIWSALSQEVRQSLRVYPAFSDLSMTDDHLDTRSLRR